VAETGKSEKQKGAEAKVEAFAKDLGPFVVACETSRMPMVFTDAKASGDPIIFVNDAFLSLTGYDRPEALGRPFNFLMEAGTDPEALAQIKAAFKFRPPVDPEIRYRRKDGSEFWASVLITPVRNESGDVVQHCASLLDVTKHKVRHEQTMLLVNELNHRVKNTLSTVQSIVRQSLRAGSNPEAIRESIDSRLFALARSHDLLSQEKWESAGMLDVVNTSVQPFVAGDRPDRFVVTDQNIRVPPDAVLALGNALNELARNALKFGALSHEEGRILVDWKVITTPDCDRLNLRWREVGAPPITPPSRKGFGSKMILDALRFQLQATVTLDYPPEGAVCKIDIPLRA